MYKSGFLTEQDTGIEHQITAADNNLLRAIVRNERHVLGHLFPSEKPRIYDLRPRTHNFTLPLKDDNDFIARVLFRLLDIGLLSMYFWTFVFQMCSCILVRSDIGFYPINGDNNNRTWAAFHGPSFGQPLWFDAALVNKLVLSVWIFIGALKVWRLRLRYYMNAYGNKMPETEQMYDGTMSENLSTDVMQLWD